MVDIARVNLYGQPVGTFRWDNNRQLAHFEYADSFIGKGLEPSPIHCQILTGEHCLIVGSRSPGVAAGTLWRHYVTSVMSCLSSLYCYFCCFSISYLTN